MMKMVKQMAMRDDFLKMDAELETQRKIDDLKIAKLYANTSKSIKQDVAKLYEKYSGNIDEVKKYGRLDNVKNSIVDEIKKVNKRSKDEIMEQMAYSYEDAYYRSAFAIENNVGIDLKFHKTISKTTEKNIYENPFDRIGFSERNKQNNSRIINNLKNDIYMGLTQGEDYGYISKRISESLSVGAFKAMRIARTETHRITGQARQDILSEANEKGVKMKKMWVATLDDRTRDAHQSLDGVTIELDEEFISDFGGRGLQPGQMGTAEDDINCRCTHIGVLAGYEPSVRRARSEAENKGELIQYKNYKEWKDAKDENKNLGKFIVKFNSVKNSGVELD